MPSYSTPEAVAGFLKDFQMRINHQKKGTFSPAHVRYFLTISRYGKEFSTSFESNPAVYGEPTVTQVFSALASDALTMRSYGLDEFVDELCEGMKPSAALRAYNSCKETYDWMRDELYLSGSEIAEISDTLSEHEDEVNALVEKATAERAAREAYDHPKVPAGFVTIEELQGDLDLGGWGDQVEDFDCDLTEAIQEVADGVVDSSYHDLLAWLPDNAEWLEEGTLPHDFTTGKWRVHLIYPGERYGLDGCLTYELNAYSGSPAAAHRASYPLVEFYDTEDNGRFVASFHMNTLLGYPWNGMVGADLDGLEAYGFAYPLSTQAATDWLEGDDLAKVNAFLKETCKEVFGILPGADDGGYSLSGEAKEAALSRFALPENRKAALNMIRKLNESRDSNENAF